MDIVWLGHSCFRIKGKESTLITDPCDPELGYPASKLQSDILTVSHMHPGHSYLEGVSCTGKVISKPGEYEVRDVLLTGWATYHDGVQGKERGNNTVFVFEIDGVTLCHLGDIGHLPETQLIPELSTVDVLFLPVGGVSTITVSQSAEIIRQISPKVVIPMHYKTPFLRRTLEPLDKFLKETGAGQKEPQPKLTVNRSNLPLTTQITVLSCSQK